MLVFKWFCGVWFRVCFTGSARLTDGDEEGVQGSGFGSQVASNTGALRGRKGLFFCQRVTNRQDDCQILTVTDPNNRGWLQLI